MPTPPLLEDAQSRAGTLRCEEDEITRLEVRPGLVMIRRRTRKADGRYLLYYEFERSREEACLPGPPSDPAESGER